MKHLILLLIFALSVNAMSVRIQDRPQLSKIVVVDGREMILLPDGRMIPHGQTTLCQLGCEIKDSIGINDQEQNRRWIVPLLIGAGIITTLILLPQPRFTSTDNPTPQTSIPPSQPPTVAAPEPATLTLMGLSFLLICKRLRRKETTK